MQEMTDERISDKHFRIRGSHELKYPPNESRCRNICGHLHDIITLPKVERVVPHRCFLGLNHTGYCEFSSTCGELRIRRERTVQERISDLSLAVAS